MKLDLAKLRNKIITDLAKLKDTATTAMTAAKESSESAPNYLQDEVGAAQGRIDLQNALSLHDHCVAQQRILNGALERMDRGDFGVCQDCGCEISERRLEAMPGATCCIHCQEGVELRIVSAPRISKPLGHRQDWCAA